MEENQPLDPAAAISTQQAIVEIAPHLRVYARSLTSNPAQADDLVQDAIVKALANLDKFHVGTNLRAWMFTILRNTFYSDLRKRRREVEDTDGEFAERVAVSPGQDVAVDFDDFKRMFAQLHESHREVLTLIGVNGCSYEDAAEICGCAVGTIKSRVNRARKRLSELMGMAAPAAEADPEEETAGD